MGFRVRPTTTQSPLAQIWPLQCQTPSLGGGTALTYPSLTLIAGVGTLLALQWHLRVQGNGPLAARSPRLHCYAFAPPCTMSLALARAARDHVTSVVLRDDFVSRWSIGSTRDVVVAAALLAKEPGVVERVLSIGVGGLSHTSSSAAAAAELSLRSLDDGPETPTGTCEFALKCCAEDGPRAGMRLICVETWERGFVRTLSMCARERVCVRVISA